MAWNYSNTAVQTTLAGGINNVTTSIVVGSVSGFPVSFPYTITLDYLQPTSEVVTVTAAAGTTLTVTRGQDSTSAQAHSSGAPVAHTVVARDLAEPQAHIPVAQAHIAASTNVHGLPVGVAVVGTTNAQTLQSKTLDNSNAATLRQDRLTLQNNVDPTKQATFELAGIFAGTTRTYTLPNASSTLVDLATAQTLTNKTLTSPVVTGSMTVNSVDYAPLGAAWSTWVPTWTNLTVGNGTTLARLRQIGKTIDYRIKFTLGTTSTVGNSPTFTLPATPHGSWQVDDMFGMGGALDAGINSYTVQMAYSGGVGLVRFNMSATAPFAFGNGDSFSTWFTYEAA